MAAGSDLSDDSAVVFGSGAAGGAPGNNLRRKRIGPRCPVALAIRQAESVGNQKTKGDL